ncbi:MAG: GAF domain-containing protein [Candidatus Rokubacteria bacterium]|nr:GAF domain-containing protein [Candidatus Rokubacteria bacterium]
MIFHKLAPLLALGLNLLLLGTALAPDRKSPREKLFACLAGALAWWNLGVFGLRVSDDPATALIWEQLLHIGVIPLPVLFYHYVLMFLGAPTRSRALRAGYVLCGGFLAVSLSPLFMSGVVETSWGYAPAAGPLYHAFFVYFQAFMVLGLARLLRSYRGMESSFRRNRTLLVIFGVVVSLLGGVVDFIRFILGWEWLYPLGIPSNAIFALALGVAIIRYRLMDVGVLVKRALLYLLTSLALAPLVLLGLSMAERLLPGQHLEGNLRYSIILLGALAIALPLLRKLECGLDRLMFQHRHGVRNALIALGKELASVLEVRILGERLTESLVTRIPLTHASLKLYDSAADAFVREAWASSGAIDVEEITIPAKSGLALWLQATGRTLVLEEAGFQPQLGPGILDAARELERHRASMLIPLRLDGQLSGILVLGEKLSGGIFEQEEIELLEMLVGETAVALRNARLYEELRNQVEELRQTQQQLVQSAKLAAIGELAANVAHEINSPLTSVLGYAGLLLNQAPPGSPARDRLTVIESETNRARKIIQDLLHFARRREPKREPVNVHDLVERALALLHGKIADGRVEVESIFDASLPPIWGDGDQLTQVFMNVVVNAVDAMPGGGRLVVRTETRDGGDPHVAITFQDTGVGIRHDQLARIFEPFYTTKPERQGTGLGLSVSLGIVKNHGGRLEVESEPGKGTTMVVLLPLTLKLLERPREGGPS